jgi:hypothetical protein
MQSCSVRRPKKTRHFLRACASLALLIAAAAGGVRAEAPAVARSFGERDANRVQLRWRHLDCESRRQQCSPSDQWRPRLRNLLKAV